MVSVHKLYYSFQFLFLYLVVSAIVITYGCPHFQLHYVTDIFTLVVHGKCSLNVVSLLIQSRLWLGGVFCSEFQQFACLLDSMQYVLWLVPWPDTTIIPWGSGRLSSAGRCTLIDSSGVKVC